MKALFTTVLLLLCLGAAAPVSAQESEWKIEGGEALYDLVSGTAMFTNGITVSFSNAVLVAEQASVNKQTGVVEAEGRVRVQSDDMIWAGDHIRYNFYTRQIESQEFRTGQAPFFAGGQGLSGDITNRVYTATNGFITLDDYSEPTLRVHAKRLVVRSNEKFEAHGATLRVGNVPVFYLPYYAQNLKATAPALTVTPGYRSRYGPFVLGSYAWDWNEVLDGKLHLDYRGKRGPGVGPDINFHLGQWGEASVRYYYLYDYDSETNSLGTQYPDNRQRVEFNWLASPYTNTTFKSRVSYQSDAGLRREYFESEYRQNIQPNTFVEGRHFWDNFSLSAIAQPRVNDFFETVERLPEIKLSGFRQQIGVTPLFYETENSAGYYQRRFAETNDIAQPGFEASRADTYHQVVLPTMLFGWLNFTPRVGGRFTYYSEASGPGATTSEVNRGVFNTGAELALKASRTWAGVQNGLFNVDGIRHIMEPSMNYVYVPRPSAQPSELPQFDYESASLRQLPIDFPDYYAIDSVDSQNVIRWGLRNRLQTKRNGQVEDLVNWNLSTDLRLDSEPGQTTFGDLFTDFAFHPRSWISLESMSRYDIDNGQCRMTFNSLALRPNTVWNWRLGYLYLRDDYGPGPTHWGEGNNLFTSIIYLRLNENWGIRAAHYFDIDDGELREQTYSLYRDFRSWTGAVSFRAQNDTANGDDYTIAFTVSLKALPRFGVGKDTVREDSLLNY